MTQKSDPEEELAHTVSSKNDRNEPVQLVADEITGDFLLIYATESGIKVQLQYDGADLWMTQLQMAQLFGRDVSSISRHITNILEEGELEEKTSLQKVQTTTGRPATLYSLDMVISVGYRVSSKQGTLFRRWATDKLVQFATKGFVIDVERLKDPAGQDHFAELREIIRDIRASEANVYKEVRQICSLCNDYGALSDKQRNQFFATVQNRLHYAVTGATGAEIRIARADATKPDMGLTSWSGDHPTQRDVLSAKNFLGEPEIKDLNRFTGMLLDYFEQETDLQRLVTMANAEAALNKFLKNNERNLLKGKGNVSKKDADRHAKQQYQIFNEARRQLRHKKSMETD